MLFFRNVAGDEVEIREGLALDSGSPYARQVFCWFHDEMGRAQGSCRGVSQVGGAGSALAMLGYTDYCQREDNQAIEQSNKTLKIDSTHGGAFAGLGDPHWQMGNDKKAIEQYIKAMQRAGCDQRAKELREDFEKNGYKGILRNHAKESEAAGYHYGAAASYAMLAENGAAFTAQEQAAAAAVIWIPSNLTQRSTISAPTRATPTCCAGSACHRKCPRRYCLAHCGSSSGFTICPSRM